MLDRPMFDGVGQLERAVGKPGYDDIFLWLQQQDRRKITQRLALPELAKKA